MRIDRGLANPYGMRRVMGPRSRDVTRLKVHARQCGAPGTGWRTVCDAADARVFETEGNPVTCRVCLFRMGLYVPLSKLHEHQCWQKARMTGVTINGTCRVVPKRLWPGMLADDLPGSY